MELFVSQCFSKKDLRHTYHKGYIFIGCNFYGVLMDGANFSDCLFIGCDFYSAESEGANFRGARFFDLDYQKLSIICDILKNATPIKRDYALFSRNLYYLAEDIKSEEKRNQVLVALESCKRSDFDSYKKRLTDILEAQQ